MERIEDKEICKRCGGKCCKKCGCDYFPSDFESLKLNDLLNKLESGNISIVSAIDFIEGVNGKLIGSPILYLRARNKNRGVIDLVSMKTECSMLSKNGCILPLKERPSGGANLKPDKSFNCHYDTNEYLENNILSWLNYQNLLSKIVKRLTGKTVREKLSEDVEDLFYKYFSRDFEGVSNLELEEIKDFIPLLVKAFPEEAYKSYSKIQRSPILKRSIKR